jgi:DNA-binding NarL/FixJ family response regulator
VAAASAVVRAGLESLLRASPALEVVGHSSSMATLAQDIESLQPDVILLEQDRQDDDLLPVLRALGPSDPQRGPRAPIVVLADDPQRGPHLGRSSASGVPSATWTTEALRAGVRALVPRSATGGEIIGAVTAAAAGLVVLHPDALDTLLPLLPAAAPSLPTAADQALTPREIEVLGMLAEGLGNKVIARRLRISEHTVKFHVGSILTKLNASSRTEAVTLGARRGLIML